MKLTNAQWELIEPLLQPPPKTDPRGRPRADLRLIVEGILWILETGARWKDLPSRYPSYQTCHRYFQIWMRKRVLYKVLATLARDLEERGKYDLSECFVDAMFVPAKKGAMLMWDLQNVAKAPRSWQSLTARVFLWGYPSLVLARMKSHSSKTF